MAKRPTRAKTSSKKPATKAKAKPPKTTKKMKKTTKKTQAAGNASSAPKRSAVAMSLHIGLNSVDPGHYDGWSGPLGACEADVVSMTALAKSRNMSATRLVTNQATRDAVLKGIRAASSSLRTGDFFFLTFSGHGGQVEDVSGEEPDKLDETWCLFDGQLIDDELFLELSKFGKGVRVLVVSDSCHSGTVTRALRPTPPPPGARMMPANIARQVYLKHKDQYDGIQRAVAKSAGGESPDAALARVPVSQRLTKIAGRCSASVILISGCQDNQLSMDGVANGAFTEKLLTVWNNGAFNGNYTRFHGAILANMPASQSPNLFQLGPAAGFAEQPVFSI